MAAAAAGCTHRARRSARTRRDNKDFRALVSAAPKADAAGDASGDDALEEMDDEAEAGDGDGGEADGDEGDEALERALAAAAKKKARSDEYKKCVRGRARRV